MKTKNNLLHLFWNYNVVITGPLRGATVVVIVW